MPAARITQSPFYAVPRVLRASTGYAWAVPSPTASLTAGERVAAGQVVGATTGQLVTLPGQPTGAFFLQVKRPTGELAWVLNTTTTRAPVPGEGVRPAPQPVRPAAPPATRPAPRPAAPVKAARRSVAARKPAPIQTGDGNGVLQAIIGNDQKTHAWLVKALYYQAKAAKVSGPDTAALDKRLQAVLASYTARQRKIRESSLIQAQAGVSRTVQGWVDRLKSLVGMSGPAAVGFLLPVAPILVGAAVSAALIGAVWLLVRNDLPPSVQDLHAAAQLTETYRSMSPDEQELFDKTTDASGKAGADSQKKGFFDGLKDNVLLIGGGILAFSILSKKKN